MQLPQKLQAPAPHLYRALRSLAAQMSAPPLRGYRKVPSRGALDNTGPPLGTSFGLMK